MKKFLLPAMLLAMCASASWGRGTTVATGSGTYNVDTIFHAKVGPGTTQTQLRLTGPSSMNVFYLTIDQTTPGVSIRTLSGGNKVAGNGTTSSMARNHSHDGLHYFAGSNGDFYFTGGKATNGSSIVGTPVCAFTVDREVFRTSASSYQFSVDMDGVARVCRLNFQKGTASHGDQTVAFKAINNDAPNNGVTLYTSKFWGSSNQTGLADNCSEVTARLVEGDNFWAGTSYRLEVTSTASRTGDLTIPDDGFVILGRGNADDFVAALQPGDIVTMDNITLTPEGEAIVPSCVISGNPKNVGGGVNLDSESERGDASDRHPRTGIGVSADGKRIVMMVVDGRALSSVGCTTGTLGDLLIFAGCAEGVNLDGGGSSTLYTEALGVRNHCSDGQERAVSNAIYAVLEAPEDNEVAELAFMDYAPTLPHLGMYTPQIIAFNKHGLALDTDFRDFTLSCDPELGNIINDGHTLYITGTGMHALTATCGDVSVSIPIEIDNASEVTLLSPSVIIDSRHPYTIGLYSTVRGARVDLNPAALSWTSADASVATVDENGTVTAVANGTVTVTGRLGDVVVEQQITVETTDQITLPILDITALSSWRQSKSDIKDVSVTAIGDDGFAADFTVSKARSPKLTLNINPAAPSYGIPEALDFNINPGNAIINKFAVNLGVANRGETFPIELYDVAAEGESLVRIPLADYFDTADLSMFPIEIRSIALQVGNDAGTVCHIEVTGIAQNYDIAQGVTDVVAPADALAVTVIGGRAVLAAPAGVITLTDLAGRVIATSTGSSIALPEGHGVVILTADGIPAKLAY